MRRPRCRQYRSNKRLLQKQGLAKWQVKDRSETKSEWYRTAGSLRVGADRMVKTGKTLEKGARGKTLVGLMNKTNWQQSNREHRYKYTGDHGEDGRHLEGGGDNHKDRWNRSGCDNSWYSNQQRWQTCAIFQHELIFQLGFPTGATVSKWLITSWIYSAFGKYSDPLTFYVTALF